MAKKALVLEGVPNPKQDQFLRAVAPRIAYGGARGGGKSWVLRRKFILLEGQNLSVITSHVVANTGRNATK